MRRGVSCSKKWECQSRITLFLYLATVDMWQARGMKSQVNPLNAELNPICHLVELLGAHSILHVSKIWVKLALTIAIRNDRVFMELTHLYSTFPHNQRNPVYSMLQVSWQWQQILNRSFLARPVCTVIRTEPLGPTATKNYWGVRCEAHRFS
jgi:hypothetical protein